MPLIYPHGFLYRKPDGVQPNSFVFDGSNDRLFFTWGSSASDANRRVWTMSLWSRSTNEFFWQARNGAGSQFNFGGSHRFTMPGSTVQDQETGMAEQSTSTFIGNNVWQHWVFRTDTTQGTLANRVRLYLNNGLINPNLAQICTQNLVTRLFTNNNVMEFMGDSAAPYFGQGKLAFIDCVMGQSLDASSFAFSDSGTWTRMPFAGSHGTHGFCLDGADGFNDVSGSGNHFTQAGGVGLDDTDLPPFIM